jgi:hypothetical protein
MFVCSDYTVVMVAMVVIVVVKLFDFCIFHRINPPHNHADCTANENFLATCRLMMIAPLYVCLVPIFVIVVVRSFAFCIFQQTDTSHNDIDLYTQRKFSQIQEKTDHLWYFSPCHVIFSKY